MAWLRLAAVPLFLCLLTIGNGSAFAETRALKLYNIHTDEKATIVFKRNGRYDQAGLNEINRFLRDWREGRVTKMDPHLLDLVWEAYRQSGSKGYIHVVSGYRSPETNGMLRRRSKGVAKNSLHMQGKAMDFYIPGVDLAQLRVIGLKMQNGGVGFYPTSGAPFVHMDTGSVRHWPRMSHQQLVKVFPNGQTLHIPSDGKPLPGYNQALAAYKARKAAGGTVAVARFEAPAPSAAPAVSEPIVVAAAVDPDEREDEVMASLPTPKPKPRRSVAVASYSTVPTPTPQPAPVRAEPNVVAALEPAVPAPAASLPEADSNPAAVVARPSIKRDFDFGSPRDWSPPTVPAALAKAMAARDRNRRGASVPIAPTIVATIDVNRPRRAAAMTTAVMRQSNDAAADLPEVLAYAPADAFRAEPSRPARARTDGVPLPIPSPMHTPAIARTAPVAPAPAVLPAQTVAPPTATQTLTLTILDTQGLRLWIGPGSTRQKSYALLTMPSFARSARLTAKPEVGFAAGFRHAAYGDLRTDHFSGPLVVTPEVVDLSPGALITAAR